MLANLALATLTVIVTVIFHFAGLVLLLRLLSYRGHGSRAQHSLRGQGLIIIVVVLGIFALTTVEIWFYAVVFLAIGAIGDFEAALYFSTVTFTSLGYGDVVLSPSWRIFGAIEAANGLMLIAWSTAFLLSLMTRLRALEHDWLEAGQHENKTKR
jgi:hypothetical protein